MDPETSAANYRSGAGTWQPPVLLASPPSGGGGGSGNGGNGSGNNGGGSSTTTDVGKLLPVPDCLVVNRADCYACRLGSLKSRQKKVEERGTKEFEIGGSSTLHFVQYVPLFGEVAFDWHLRGSIWRRQFMHLCSFDIQF